MGSMSDAFSETATYAVGDYCIYQDVLYKFIATKSAGAWDVNAVSKTTIDAELKSLLNQVNTLNSGGAFSFALSATPELQTYNLNWSQYRILVFSAETYGNYGVSILVLRDTFEDMNYGTRILLPFNNSILQIYPNGTDKIYVSVPPNLITTETNLKIIGLNTLG